ncbi:hypothetical protein GGTG_04644 [Gaeumannomyces tritici R3-111a-1]|uniref:Uncharacterized protein n=1 Tax=Gaeumannomyces tritici (strain R3-111a-1) TaxID=644352 RepID=J3NTP4_GAET3|nr:hypothetical protein GGTG_04644 [Gaeumannomyces tritici R3-111a-1]EJT79559.1 hypothetical protein GGTG_04644 [Gaeumannomyces tritici R3-111a-1]
MSWPRPDRELGRRGGSARPWASVKVRRRRKWITRRGSTAAGGLLMAVPRPAQTYFSLSLFRGFLSKPTTSCSQPETPTPTWQPRTYLLANIPYSSTTTNTARHQTSHPTAQETLK